MYRFTTRFCNESPWRIDADGFLRVSMCVLRPGVFEYDAKDIPEEIRKKKPDLKVWRVRIPENAFDDSFLKSSEGKPVIAWSHDWQETANIDKETLVGAMAGTALMEAGAMLIDAVISDKKTIEAVKGKNLEEVSAGYHSEIDVVDGDAEADAIQKPTMLNHVVLLPKGKGRCGPSVRIINSKRETVMVHVKLTNSKGVQKTYAFENEADAKAAEEMVQEHDGEHKADMEAKNHDLASAQSEFAKINQQLQALEASKLLLEQQIKQFESEEYQEAQGAERAQYSQDEKAVVENCSGATSNSDGKGPADLKEKVEGELKNAKTMNERRKIVTSMVCNAKGIPYDESNVKLLFGVLARTMNKASATEVRKPIVTKTVNADDKKHPIFQRKG